MPHDQVFYHPADHNIKPSFGCGKTGHEAFTLNSGGGSGICCVCKVLVKQPVLKSPLKRPDIRWRDNIKTKAPDVVVADEVYNDPLEEYDPNE